MNYEFAFRKYVETDYDFVYNVKKICYKKYVDEYYDGWNDEMQHKMFDNFLETEKENIKIILIGNEKIGFTNGKLLPNGEYEQGNICILPQWQGHGIGTAILKEVISEHKNCNIVLRVFKSNPAQHLYERLGFTKYNETNSHFLMRKNNF